MADKKITELTPTTGANLVDADEFVVVDVSADETKSVTRAEFFKSLPDIGGKVTVLAATGSGTLTLVSTQNLADAGQKIAFFGAGRSESDEEMAYIQGLLVGNSGGAGNVQSGQLAFGTSGSEAMRIDVSGHAIIPAGVTLGTAAGVYAVDNTLDDFELGTWTPVITDGTNNATSDVAVGSYTKVGNHVHVQGRIRLSSFGSVTGSLEMSGLPFSSQSVTNNFSAMTVGRAVGLNLTAGTVVVGDLRANVTKVQLNVWDASLGNTDLQDTEFTSDGDISFSMDYISN